MAALKEREYFLEILMILSYFKPKKSPFWLFLIENWSKIHKIGDYCGKKSSKSEEYSKINFYSLVPKIDHPVALWVSWIYSNLNFYVLEIHFTKFFELPRAIHGCHTKYSFENCLFCHVVTFLVHFSDFGLFYLFFWNF